MPSTGVPIRESPASQRWSMKSPMSGSYFVNCRELDPSAADFLHKITTALQGATKDSIRPIVIVDPRCLAQGNGLAALTSLLQRQWYTGFVLPVDKMDQELVSQMEKLRPVLQPSADARDWVVVRISIGTMAEFRTAVISVADEILARIVKTAEVRRPHADKAGPNTRPRIANTLDRRKTPDVQETTRPDYHVLFLQGRHGPDDGGFKCRLDTGQQWI